MEGGFGLEHKLHQEFDLQRLRGEWFMLDAELRAWLHDNLDDEGQRILQQVADFDYEKWDICPDFGRDDALDVSYHFNPKSREG